VPNALFVGLLGVGLLAPALSPAIATPESPDPSSRELIVASSGKPVIVEGLGASRV